MMLVRRRGTYHVEIHDEIELLAFIPENTPFGELSVSGIDIYFNHEIVVMSVYDHDLVPKFAKYLMDTKFFVDMETEYSE